MYTVSTEFKEKIQLLDRTFTSNIKIHHSSGVLDISDVDLVGGTLVFNESSQSGEDFTVGGVVASDISFEILKKPEYKDINFIGARVVVNIGLLLEESPDTETYFLSSPQASEFAEGVNNERWEYVPLGTFNIDEITKQRNTISIMAIDNMINLDKPYSNSELLYPANLYSIYVDICNSNNLTIGTTDFPNKDYMVQTRPEGDLSFRDMLGYVAELSGTFGKVNRLGALELKWYTESEVAIEPKNRFDFKVSDDTVMIKGITVTTEDTTYVVGNEDYAIDLSENPLLQGEYETVLLTTYNSVNSTICVPYEASWQGNPALQSGDIITHLDVDGNVINTIVTNSTFKYRGKSNINAKGIAEISQGYKGSTDKKLADIKRKVEVDVDNKITTLEQAQLNATELIANMMGGHLIKHEGSIYIADNPDIDVAQKVWKWGLGGFGYSKDGIAGSYTTGITADGSIVAMLVSANIITADMIQTGRITSEDGNTWIDLNSGYFSLKNRVKFDENGFSISLTSQDIESIANINIILENENQSIGTNGMGTTTSGKLISSKVSTFKGATRIESIIGTVKLRTNDGLEILTGGTTGISLSSVNPTDLVDGKVSMIVDNNVTLPTDSGYIEIPITIDGTLLSKKIHWSKVRDGVKGDKGEIGDSGKGISNIEEFYLVSPLSTGIKVIGNTWKTAPPTTSELNRYLWNYEKITYSNDDSFTSIPALIGTHSIDGGKGEDGVGIDYIRNHYLVTYQSSGVQLTDVNWSTEVKAVDSVNRYLWNYDEVYYTDGSIHGTDPRIIGAYGQDASGYWLMTNPTIKRVDNQLVPSASLFEAKT